MELNQLIYYIRVCKDQSYTKASKNLFISQQGLSMSIKRLEDELNTKILNRTPNGLIPTEKGLYLLTQAEQICGILGEIADYFRIGNNFEQETVVACLTELIGRYPEFFVPLMTKEIQTMNVRFIESSATSCEEMLLNGEVDLALLPDPIDFERFETTRLFCEPDVVVCRNDHGLTKHEKVNIGNVLPYDIICYSTNAKNKSLFETHCSARGIEPNVRLTITSPTEIFRIINELPNSIGICPYYFAYNFLSSNLKAIPFDNESPVWCFYLIKKRNVSSRQSVEQFIKYTSNYFAQRPEISK